ncbi:hypothetical protein QR680_017688 [Steinernema hermaphroditum]|uniref:Uncharacterized protein n=1 Tax=Steinernema hermaphroditum TaxID=289476 RepID=A0AA39LPK5_9BILA|nr:hypothetical protein QR680_017688 [Steinernema hermaphroditum]
MPTEHHVSDGLAYCAELVLWKPASIYKSFCPGLEWDLMYLHSIRFSGNAKFYIDIIFDIALQRKTLFYARFVLTTVTLIVFCLFLIQFIPPISKVIPLVGKCLLSTMFLLSVIDTTYLSVIDVTDARLDALHLHSHYIKTPTPGAPVSTSSTSHRWAMVDGQMRLSQLAQLRGMRPDLIRCIIDDFAFISVTSAPPVRREK